MSTLMSLNSVSTFERDPRRIQELKLRPVADAIYRQLFTQKVGIARYEKTDDFLLDKHFAIDVRLTIPSGQVLTAQEKFLSYEYAKFHTLTVEYEQNQFTHERGDWYKLAPQLYFVGYASQDERSFVPWVLVNWPALVLATNKEQVKWGLRANQNGRAKASFRWIDMYQLPSHCIIACSWTTKHDAGTN